MVVGRKLFLALLFALVADGASGAAPVWALDPDNPGPDIPPQGRSLFDHLTIENGRQTVPFPFTRLLQHLRKQTDREGAYLDHPLKTVLIPLGRSLQRNAAAPAFFASPRVVVAVDAEPAADEKQAGVLLRDRLFLGYLEAAGVLEVISYNEAAARFEFQVVRDYRPGGSPRVQYSRRVVCMACHQNGAPIFARPLWDETNANAHVARQLQDSGRDFYRLPTRAGVDAAYAIDNATDRANDFALTQRLWGEGCGDGRQGGQCRSALLARALQLGLSGGRGFERSSEVYDSMLRQVMQRQRLRLWPDGLWLPDPDIPNRRPLQAGMQKAAYAADADAGARSADVPAALDPLLPRPPKSHWSPDADELVSRAVHGLAQFLARPDLVRLDARLAAMAAADSLLQVSCAGRPVAGSQGQRLKLVCNEKDLAFTGIIYRAEADKVISGRLRNLRVRGEDQGSVVVAGNAAATEGWQMTLRRPDALKRVRLADGDALGMLTLAWPDSAAAEVRVSVQLRHEFESVLAALQRLETHPDRPLVTAVFGRAEILPLLFAELQMDHLDWCCSQTPPQPKIQTEKIEAAPKDTLLAPFFTVCGACHRSAEPFPPNFLAGSAEQVLGKVAQCAERIQYRLAMWDLSADQRAKTPMPPVHTGAMGDTERTQWANGLLPKLRQSLREIARLGAVPLSERQLARSKQYSDLRACLPTG